MLNQYETVFMMTPVLSDDQMKETVKKFENILLEKGAEIIHQENWGLRRLEYPIAKKTSGFYHLIQFAAEGNVVKDFELQYRRDERIMRYLTVALDKHAIAYSEKRRSLRKDLKTPQVAVESTMAPVPEVVILPAEIDVDIIDEPINE